MNTATEQSQKIFLIGASPKSLNGIVDNTGVWERVLASIDPWANEDRDSIIIFSASAKDITSSPSHHFLYRLSNGVQVLIYDPIKQTIGKEGQKQVELTNAENDVLYFLVQRAGEIIGQKDFIISTTHNPNDRRVDARISRLKNKFRDVFNVENMLPFIITKHRKGRTIPSSCVRPIPREQWVTFKRNAL